MARASRISGTPESIADQVMPVLRARGMAREGYESGTLRHKIFGHDRLPASHPAAVYRGVFA